MLLKLVEVKDRSFTGDDGRDIDYYFYKAVRESDGVTIQVGCKEGDLPLNKVADYEVEKTEGVDKNGKIVYRYKIVI